MVVALLLLIPILLFLPQIIKAFGELKGADKTQEQIATELEEETIRGDKGAVCNSIDFLFGEGTCKDSGQRPDLEDKNQEMVEESADEAEERDTTKTSDDTIKEVIKISSNEKKRRFRSGR